MSRESKTSVKKKSNSKSPTRPDSPSAVKKKPSVVEEGGGGENKDDNQVPQTPVKATAATLEGIGPLPETPSTTVSPVPPASPSETSGKTGSSTAGHGRTDENSHTRTQSEDKIHTKDKKKEKASRTPRKGGGGTPRGGHHGSRPQRGELRFGERPSRYRDSIQQHETRTSEEHHPDDHDHFDASKFQRMTALYFHKHNDLSRSARGVGYTPDQAVPKYGPGVTEEAEQLYGPCKLLTDFQYSTWTETVVPLRNHNVVQGFNEMILFLIKLAANPDGPVNHEEAFMATSFLANIRNDLGEHPPNVLALLEYIDFKTLDDGTEPANPETEVIPPCKASERY